MLVLILGMFFWGMIIGVVISETRSIEHSSMMENRKNKGGKEETTQKRRTGLRN
jgi:hypothetical protein